MRKFVAGICLILSLVLQIEGHGMLLEPVGRGSRWRNDPSAPKNYDDNANYCGGLWVGIFNIFSKRNIFHK